MEKGMADAEEVFLTSGEFVFVPDRGVGGREKDEWSSYLIS